MKTLCIVALCLGFVACDKHEEVDSGLVGKWELVEQYRSIGGPGTWEQADPKNPQFISFENSGTVSFTPESQYNAKSYRITSDSTLVMIRGSEEFLHKYKLDDNQLELSPPCIEGCTARYTRVRK